MNSEKEYACNIKLFWGVHLILNSCPNSRVELDRDVLTFYGPPNESDEAMKILEAIETLEGFGRSFKLIIKEEK